MEIINFNNLNNESYNSYKQFLVTQNNLNASILVNYSTILYGISIQDWSFFLGSSVDEIEKAIDGQATVLEQTAAQIVLIFEVYAIGVHIFGNKADFNKWLTRGRSIYDGIQPRKLLTNPLGIICLEKELHRMGKATSQKGRPKKP